MLLLNRLVHRKRVIVVVYVRVVVTDAVVVVRVFVVLTVLVVVRVLLAAAAVVDVEVFDDVADVAVAEGVSVFGRNVFRGGRLFGRGDYFHIIVLFFRKDIVIAISVLTVIIAVQVVVKALFEFAACAAVALIEGFTDVL